MQRTNLWNDFASRVALDERVREAHLQLELERREARLGGRFAPDKRDATGRPRAHGPLAPSEQQAGVCSCLPLNPFMGFETFLRFSHWAKER
jgi:hypothetical protein